MATNEAWRTQLSQLNERARVYTARQWQVPFAYIAVVGVALGNLLDVIEQNRLDEYWWLLIAISIVGALVRWHMWYNRDGAMRAVCRIQQAEVKLEIAKCSDNASARHRLCAFVPLEWMVSAIALACLLGALKCSEAGDWLCWVSMGLVVMFEFLSLWCAKCCRDRYIGELYDRKLQAISERESSQSEETT